MESEISSCDIVNSVYIELSSKLLWQKAISCKCIEDPRLCQETPASQSPTQDEWGVYLVPKRGAFGQGKLSPSHIGNDKKDYELPKLHEVR